MVLQLKFIADSMLGKLSRWLRILGYNVKYDTSLNDEQLIEIAKNERRTLLTRDFTLYKRALVKGIDTFLVEGENEAEKIAKVVKKHNLSLEVNINMSRCPKCNTRIKSITKESVIGVIPKSTSLHYDTFWKCPKCGQIYWQGSHWKRIDKTLMKAKMFAFEK
jgi:uncharacterized protein with PIN domain